MKKILLYLILIMAIGMAGTVAYVSVSGLLKVFTGAGMLGLMLFSAIEIAKIVATSAIHTYGKTIGWFYNSLLAIAILISMAITSMGIYGFLSSSYKESFAKMENTNSQVELLETKRDGYKSQLTVITTEKESINTMISELTKGLSNNVIQYKDPKTGQILTSTSSSTRKTLEKQLDNAIIRQEVINQKADSLSTLIFNLENEILETKLGDGSSSELSTLKYLSDITGKSMDEVMKWFILLLIIIGDPMAVLLVIVFNKVVNNSKGPDKSHKLDKTDNPKYDDDDDYFNSGLMDMSPINYQNTTHTPNGDGVNDGVNDGVIMDEETGEFDLSGDILPIQQEFTLESPVDEHIVEPMENSPQEQITENIEEVKQLKREPVIPRGRIIEEDVVKKRDFSVDVPEPVVTRIGTNKEIRDNKNNVIFFKRKRPDELTNEG